MRSTSSVAYAGGFFGFWTGGVRWDRQAASARNATTSATRLVIPRLELVLELTPVVPPRDPEVRRLHEVLGRRAGHESRPEVGVDAVGAGDAVEQVLQLVGRPLVGVRRPLAGRELLAERAQDRRNRLLARLDELSLGLRAVARRALIHRE